MTENRKSEEIVKQRHKAVCINRYLTNPDEIVTDRHVAFHPMVTKSRYDQSLGLFVRMTSSGLF